MVRLLDLDLGIQISQSVLTHLSSAMAFMQAKCGISRASISLFLILRPVYSHILFPSAQSSMFCNLAFSLLHSSLFPLS